MKLPGVLFSILLLGTLGIGCNQEQTDTGAPEVPEVDYTLNP
ncbi:hypothetical protein [Fodinibius saliphilus]|nr:hypothetical protein [Fodinibius saliphilus]